METRYDVIVIGAGLAGLTAAATASAAGAGVLVLDRQAPGGRSSTDTRAGCFVNRGAHAFYKGSAGAGVLRRLGIDVRGSQPDLADSKLIVEEAMVDFPGSPGSLISNKWLSAGDKARLVGLMASLWLRHRRRDHLAATSASQWLSSFELTQRARLVAEALIRVTSYCSDLDNVSADVAALQLCLGTHPGVLYLDGGWAQLTSALGSRVPRVEKAVVGSIAASPGGFLISSETGEFRSRSIVVALESRDSAIRLLGGLQTTVGIPEVGPAVSAACLDVVSSSCPRPTFALGTDQPVYLSLHSKAAALGVDPKAEGPWHVVHLMRYGTTAAADDRQILEALALRAGLTPEGTLWSRFFAHLKVVSGAPTASLGGMAGRPGVSATGLPGCFLAGDWVGPVGWLADASFASGEHAGALAAASRPGASRPGAEKEGRPPWQRPILEESR